MTSDGDALLAAILAEPEDDTRRLVYADWLDEQGEHGRAEFIRVQIEMERLRDDRDAMELDPRSVSAHEAGGSGSAECPHCQVLGRLMPLLDRERKLLDVAAVEDWAAIPAAWGVKDWYFRRGFVESVTCTAADFLAHTDAILWHPKQGRACPATAHPIRKVTLTSLPLFDVRPGTESIKTTCRLRGRKEWVPVDDGDHIPSALLRALWDWVEFELPDTASPLLYHAGHEGSLGQNATPPEPQPEFVAVTPAGYVPCGSGFVPDSGWLLTIGADQFEPSDLRSRRPYVQPANIRGRLTRLVPVGTVNPPQPTVADRGTVFGPVSCHDNAMLMRGRCQAVLRDVAMDMSNYGPAYMRYEADVIGDVEWTVGVDGDDVAPHGGGGIPV
jgi:uncharacterized protein (TIGR02996 family)